MYKFLLPLCFLSVGCPGGLCGDGVLDSGEACDDGNTANADGCEADCSLLSCQNGIVDSGEVCFFESIKFETDFSPQEVVVGDINGDGSLDLVTTNTAESLSVLLGDGAGGFSRLSDVEVEEGGDGLVVGDINGDGVLDLVSSSSIFNKIEVFRGLGDGSFAPLVTLPVVDPDSLVVADFNGDELPDLASTSDSGVVVFLATGGGAFLGTNRSETGSRLVNLQVGDFNGDSVLDLVTLTKDNENIFLVLFGDGAGNFAVQASQSAGEAGNMLVEDFNGDNVPDLALSRLFSGEFSVLAGNGLGSFSELQTIEVGSPSALASGDINGDGVLDLAVSSGLDEKNIAHLAISLGDSAGSFSNPLLFSAGFTDPRGIALADFNSDGALDVVLTDQAFGQVLVFLSEP